MAFEFLDPTILIFAVSSVYVGGYKLLLKK